MAQKIWVTVKPLAKHENVTLYTDGELLALVKAPANEGKTNSRLIELLAEYFHTAKSKIRILRGQRSRRNSSSSIDARRLTRSAAPIGSEIRRWFHRVIFGLAIACRRGKFDIVKLKRLRRSIFLGLQLVQS